MKKIFFALLIIAALIATGVFVDAADFSTEFQDFILKIAEQRGINDTSNAVITQVDFNDAPLAVTLGNIDQSSLRIYQINVGTGDPVYVITMSQGIFEKTISGIDLKRSYLNFGFAGKMPAAGFLKTSTEVITGLEKGYVMVRAGSITGISTNLDVTKSDPAGGQVNIIIYKNGNPVGFGNTLIATSNGVKTDHDTQSEGIITFAPGDVISAYADQQGNIDWSDVITLIEITSES